MQVAVEKVSELQRKMKVSVPSEKIEQEVAMRLKKAAQSVKMKGFRPGKVPLDMVKTQYGDSIRQEVLGEVIRSSFYDALTQEKIAMAGMPQIEPKSIIAGAPFEYEATFEVYPEIKLQELKDAVIEKLTATITAADVDKMLEKLRGQHVKWQEVNRPAQWRDRLTIDFEGSIDNEKFQGGKAEGFNLVLGDKNLIAGFEQGLVGAEAGKDYSLPVTFPNDYPQKTLAGKAAVFAVKVHNVFEPQLPDLDEAFAQKLEVASVEVLRSEVQTSMEREVQRASKENVKKQVIAELIKRNPLTIPEALIDAEIQHMQQQMMQRMGGNNKKMPPLPKEPFIEQAKQRVLVGLLFAELVKIHALTADKQRMQAVIAEMASAYDSPEEVINYYLQNKNASAQIESLVLEEQAVEKLLEAAQVQEKVVSYDELVNKNSEKE